MKAWRSANVYIVGTEDGIVTSRSLTRRPILNRWSSERLAALKATPWSDREKPEVQVRFQEEATAKDEQPAAPAAAPSLRRFRINKKDLEEFGFTDGCVQCDHVARYGMAKPGGNHTDACRTRILTELAKTELGQQRLAAWNERISRSVAEHVERADNEAKGDGNTGTGNVHTSNDKRETPAEAPHDTTAREPVTGGTAHTKKAQTPADEPGMAQNAPHQKGTNPRDVLDDCTFEEAKQHQAGMGPWRGGNNATPRGDEAGGDEAMQDENAAEEEEEEPTAMDMGFIGSLEPEVDDVVSGLLL